MGHRNIKHINKIKSVLQIKINKCACSDECLECLKGKFHALPFPQISDKPENPREIITTDICGPFTTQSLGGSRYFVTFTCASTDYTFRFLATLRNKSDCKMELINFINRCVNQFGSYPKTIRSDQGGEYLDNELQQFLNKNGINFQCSVARCPQQNGISERKNRTLVEGIRTALISKNLPKYLWAEALFSHVNNSFNNIPKSNETFSPKEAFFGKKCDFQFYEFGSRVMFLSNSQNKLEPRGETGVFVGIDSKSKGFRIYSGGKLKIERHVKFLSEIANSEASHDNSKFDHNESDINDSPIVENELRRSERLRSKQCHKISHQPFEPTTCNQVLKCQDKEKWILAMQEELQSLEDNNGHMLIFQKIEPRLEANGCLKSKWTKTMNHCVTKLDLLRKVSRNNTVSITMKYLPL